MNRVLFSSKNENWETQTQFFQALDAEFHFDIDVCALPENAKCTRYYTPEDDGLTQPWNGTCWCNPPYGRSIAAWVKKAAESETTVVMLLPLSRFHEYIYGKAEVRFIKGRLKFGGAVNSAPFPSMVVIFRRA